MDQGNRSGVTEVAVRKEYMDKYDMTLRMCFLIGSSPIKSFEKFIVTNSNFAQERKVMS